MTQQTGPILLATDLSARGDRALDRALQLTKALNTKLIVLHVMESHSTSARLTTPVWRRLSSDCLLYTSPSPRDRQKSRMPSSA